MCQSYHKSNSTLTKVWTWFACFCFCLGSLKWNCNSVSDTIKRLPTQIMYIYILLKTFLQDIYNRFFGKTIFVSKFGPWHFVYIHQFWSIKSAYHKVYVYNFYTEFIQNLCTNKCMQNGFHISTHFYLFVVHFLTNHCIQLRLAGETTGGNYQINGLYCTKLPVIKQMQISMCMGKRPSLCSELTYVYVMPTCYIFWRLWDFFCFFCA